MINRLILIALWPIVRAEYALRRFGVIPDRMSRVDGLAIEHGSLETGWFY